MNEQQWELRNKDSKNPNNINPSSTLKLGLGQSIYRICIDMFAPETAAVRLHKSLLLALQETRLSIQTFLNCLQL